MERYSIVGVAKAMLIDANNNLLGSGIIDTLSNSSIEFGTSSTELRGGSRNKLIDVYYHTPTGSLTISDVKFNLDILGANVGGQTGVGGNIFKNEVVTLVGQSGTVSQTPVVLSSTDTEAVGWVCYQGATSKITFTGTSFTAPSSIPANSNVIVTYYQMDVNAEYVEIPASIIPERIRVVLTVDLSTNDTSIGIVGYAQFDIPVFQLSGSQTINMTPDGFATTDLTGMILEDGGSNCVGLANEIGGGKYARATLIINNKNWYDDVVALAIEGGDMTVESGSTVTLRVYAVTSTGKSFLADNSQLTFTGTSVTVGANTGVISNITTSGSVKVVITGKTDIEANATITVE